MVWFHINMHTKLCLYSKGKRFTLLFVLRAIDLFYTVCLTWLVESLLYTVPVKMKMKSMWNSRWLHDVKSVFGECNCFSFSWWFHIAIVIWSWKWKRKTFYQFDFYVKLLCWSSIEWRRPNKVWRESKKYFTLLCFYPQNFYVIFFALSTSCIGACQSSFKRGSKLNFKLFVQKSWRKRMEKKMEIFWQRFKRYSLIVSMLFILGKKHVTGELKFIYFYSNVSLKTKGRFNITANIQHFVNVLFYLIFHLHLLRHLLLANRSGANHHQIHETTIVNHQNSFYVGFHSQIDHFHFRSFFKWSRNPE